MLVEVAVARSLLLHYVYKEKACCIIIIISQMRALMKKHFNSVALL